MPETATIPSVQTFSEFVISVNETEIPQTVSKIIHQRNEDGE